MSEENIVKKTCRELSLTHAELSNLISYKPDTVNKAASTGKISNQLQGAIEMYLKIIELEEELKDYENLKTSIKKAISQ